MTENEKSYLTPKEVVAMLAGKGIETTDDTVRNWCVKGIQNKKRPEKRHFLGHFKLGGRIMVVRTDLIAFLPLLRQHPEDL